MNLDRDTEHLLWRVSELPWKMKVEHKPEYSLMSVEANNGSVIAEFDCCDDQWSNEEGFANAGLIAAAPRLYDCLYKLYKDYILPFGFDSLNNLPSELVDKTVEALNMAAGHRNDKDVSILPCPFCGCRCECNKQNNRFFVRCTNINCGYFAPFAESEYDAIAAHNRVAKKCKEVVK